MDDFLIDFERLASEPPRAKRFGRALLATDPQTKLLAKDLRQERDKAFEEIVKYLQNVAHHNYFPSEIELRQKLERFESLLLNYLTPCTASQQRELLELIRGPVNSKALDRAKELISHKTANYVFFFEKLDNPKWLPLLIENGFFKNLPEPEPTENGGLIYHHHMPLMVLNRGLDPYRRHTH